MRSKVWIARSNIEMFKRKITEAKDREALRILEELLAKEEQKLRDLQAGDDGE